MFTITMFDLLVVGEINPDLILRGEGVVPTFGQVEQLVEHAALTLGASSVIVACGAVRLGLKVAFVGVVGDDLFGHFMLKEMAKRGIDTSGCIIDSSLQTGFSVILACPDGDKAILTFPGTIAALQATQINPTFLERARHLHLSSYFLLDGLRSDVPALFAAAKHQGMTTSLDTNWDPREQWDLKEVLAHCDLFLPNEAEACAITGKREVGAALAKLSQQVPMLAVKRGALGGVAQSGMEQVSAAPLQVEVVDTVGAGDSFDAGFLYGYLQGWSLSATLDLALVCGSLSTRAAGGTPAQPTLAEAQAALAAQRAL